MELPADFLSLGRGSVNLVSEPGLGDSLPVFRAFSTVFPLKKIIIIFLLKPILFC